MKQLFCPGKSSRNFFTNWTFLLAVVLWTTTPAVEAADGQKELFIPVHTAYAAPRADALSFRENRPVKGWADPETHLLFFGRFAQAGRIRCSLAVGMSEGARLPLRVKVGPEERQIELAAGSKERTNVFVGEFQIRRAGFERLSVSLPKGTPDSAGLEIHGLVLSGEGIENAHFNLKERRNAASVHLAYPVGKEEVVDAFYCEVTGVEEPIWTFYMACGWHRGYFGMQINSERERRIIFSVWDSGNEAVDRGKVAKENRVQLLKKGEGVYAGDFGNEGTGGHSHLKYLWKTGETQKFLVTAEKPDEEHTIYTGWYYHPGKQEWMVISSWNAPREKAYLRGLHSFSENFGGANGHLLRKARFGRQWAHVRGVGWKEMTKATFSHDVTGRSDRMDRFMGVEGSEFFLSHGGYVEGYTKFGAPFERAPGGDRPGLPDLEWLQ